jgi:hypothetical protein
MPDYLITTTPQAVPTPTGKVNVRADYGSLRISKVLTGLTSTSGQLIPEGTTGSIDSAGGIYAVACEPKGARFNVAAAPSGTISYAEDGASIDLLPTGVFGTEAPPADRSWSLTASNASGYRGGVGNWQIGTSGAFFYDQTGELVASLPATSPKILGNANDTVPSTVRMAIISTNLSASRTYTIPSPASYHAGATLTIVDSTLSLTSAITATLVPADGTINGAGSMVLSTPGAAPVLISDGVSKWNLDLRGNTQAFIFEYATNNAGVSVTAGVSTFTPPAGWTTCRYQLIQGGAGGGSGRRGAAGTIRLGGTGGAGGNRTDGTLFSSLVAAGDWTIKVGNGGAGGTAPAADNTDGNKGSVGIKTDIFLGATQLAAAGITQAGVSGDNTAFGFGGTADASLAGNTNSSRAAHFQSATSGAVNSAGSSGSSSATPGPGVSGPGGGSLDASNTVRAPGTGYGGPQTGGVANASGGGAAPTGSATGYGTGGAGAGGGTNGSTGAPGGNGTPGLAILIFNF